MHWITELQCSNGSPTFFFENLSTFCRSLIDSLEFFRKIGAPTVAVAAADGTREEEQDSTGFWKKVGFEPIPARLMIYFNVQGEDDEN